MREVAVQLVRVQRSAVQVVIVLLPVGVSIFIPPDGLILRPAEGDGLHLRKSGDVIAPQKVVQRGLIDVHRVLIHQIDAPVPQREVPLAVHLAVIAHQDLIVCLPGGDVNGADRILQAVLGIVRHVLNDECRTQLGELVQQLLQLFRVHGECLVTVVEPVPIFVEGQGHRSAVLIRIGPGDGCSRIRRQLEHHLAALPDVLPGFFGKADAHGGTHRDHQDAGQQDQPRLSRHFCSLLLRTTTAMPAPRNARGIRPIISTWSSPLTLSLMVR